MTFGPAGKLQRKSVSLATLVLWLVSLHCCLLGQTGFAGNLCEMAEASTAAPAPACHGEHSSDETDGEPSQSPHDKLDCCDEQAMLLVSAGQTLTLSGPVLTGDFSAFDTFPKIPVRQVKEIIPCETWPPGAALLTSQFIGSSLFGRAPPAMS